MFLYSLLIFFLHTFLMIVYDSDDTVCLLVMIIIYLFSISLCYFLLGKYYGKIISNYLLEILRRSQI